MLAIDTTAEIFDPGSPIIGTVSRRAPIVTTAAKVSIRLFGRAKVKIVQRHGNSHSTYRSQYRFFHTNANDVELLLYNGPMHIERSGGTPETWQFAMNLPAVTGIDPRSFREDEPPFPPLDPMESTPVDALPSTFFFGNPESYVEYYLEARLQYQHKGRWEHYAARLPIEVRATPLSSPIRDWKLQRRAHRESIHSYLLAPGMDGAGLSLKQKSKQLFHTSSVPKLEYRIELVTPSIIQLDHPDTIPLTLRFVPDRNQTSEVLHDVPIPVTLTSIRISYRWEVYVQAPGSFGIMRTDNGTERGDFLLQRVFNSLKEPVMMTVADDAEATDFGALFKLQLRDKGLYSNNRHLGSIWGGVMRPDFATHNIKIVQVFKYYISYRILDKAEELKFEVPTRIVPRPLGLNEPPPPFVEPPPFTDVPIDGDAGPSNGPKAPPPTFEEAIAEAGPSSIIVTGDSKVSNMDPGSKSEL